MADNVVLIGMMGSGKTTVGRAVADQAGMDFVDLDEMVEDRAGMGIPDIFAQSGEGRFRELETEALRELVAAHHTVLATGGGIVTRAENRRLLRELGKVFWLDAPAETLLSRIGDDENRPMLRGGDPLKRIEALLAERREFYGEASDIHLDTSELQPDEIAERIVADIEQNQPEESDVFATIVAIDGPVGSGKSSVAKALANRLGFVHVDTGAMYRCVTLEVMRRGVAFDDAEGMTKVAHEVDIRFEDPDDAEGGTVPAEKRIFLDGQDVTEAIRSPEVSRNTSPVADVATVRAEMVRLQRQLALRGRSVLEGRDISSVVVPEARWQIYLTASLDERVGRRLRQYEAKGTPVDRDELRRDVAARDERDRSRPQGALKLSPEATIFDTTGIELDEVVETLSAMIENLKPLASGR